MVVRWAYVMKSINIDVILASLQLLNNVKRQNMQNAQRSANTQRYRVIICTEMTVIDIGW